MNAVARTANGRRVEMKERRLNVTLTELAAAEFDRLEKQTGMSTAELLTRAVTLLRIYVDSRAEGKEIRVVNPRDIQDQARIELRMPKGESK